MLCLRLKCAQFVYDLLLQAPVPNRLKATAGLIAEGLQMMPQYIEGFDQGCGDGMLIEWYCPARRCVRARSARKAWGKTVDKCLNRLA